MTPEMWITLAILATAIFLFVSELLRVDVVALGVVIALMLTGILTTGEAIAGFSSTAVITIGALFVVGGAVMQTGLAAMIANRILNVAGGDETRLIILVMCAAAAMSGVLSDTGVVAVMLPAIVSLAAGAKISPSKLLIPLAYGSLLGGAATLIGTPPNIIVSDLLRQQGQEPFQFFSYTPLGIILVIAGVIFMLTIGKRLLPDHKPRQQMQQMETPKELFTLYKLPDNLFRLRVRSVSPLIGQPISASELRSKFDVNIIEVIRQPQARSLAALGSQRLLIETGRGETFHHPNPDFTLMQDDILIVKGEGNDVGRAAGYWNLAIQPVDSQDQEKLVSREVGIAEVLLRPRSPLIGQTLTELRFGTTYRLTVLDIKRPDTDEKLNLKSTPLKFGDILIVQGEWKDIFALKRRRHDFIVMGEPEAAEMGAFLRTHKAPLALLILLGMVGGMVIGEALLTMVALIAALAMVLTGCITMDEAYDAIDWKSLILIAGMLPMSTALQKVGLVSLISTTFTDVMGGLGPVFVLAGIFLLTSLFTQVLSNTATAVLVAPIAYAISIELNISPMPLLMAVAVAASMAFASPVASPVNTLVMGAGRYRFFDYIKIGVPMLIIALIVSTIFLPIIFPF